jgi:hypothetical protein
VVTPDLLTEFYRERVDNALAHIRYLALDTGEMSRIREMFRDDWEIEELTRAIIFDEAQIIESLRKEIEHARTARKELKRV